MRTGRSYSGRFEQPLAAMRSAGQKPGPALNEQSHVVGVERVHVLQRIDRIEDRRSVDLRRQRQLHKNAVDGPIGIQRADQFQQFALRSP